MSKTRALSVRQPYAEMIIRGEKKIEFRSRRTHIRGRVYIYASKQRANSEDFVEQKLLPSDLPVGCIIGTVEIVGCRSARGEFEWDLENPRRFIRPLKPKKKGQPVFFYPY